MKKSRGKSALELRRLRKKFHLGEFRSKRAKKSRAKVLRVRRAAARKHTILVRTLDGDRQFAGGSGGLYEVPLSGSGSAGGLLPDKLSEPKVVPDKPWGR